MTKSVRNPGDPEVEDLPVTPDDMAAMGLQSGDAAMRGEKPAPMPRVPRVPKKELSEEEQAALEEKVSALEEKVTAQRALVEPMEATLLVMLRPLAPTE